MKAQQTAVRGASLIIGLVLLSASGGCKREAPEVVVYTSVDQVFSEPILRAFESEQGFTVRAVFDTEETKSTGVLNRLIAEAVRPQADVFWSGDPVRPSLLVKRGLVEPYVSPNASSIPEAFKDPFGSWTGFAARARVLLVNRNRVPPGEMPKSIQDLADPRWRGEVAIANPLFGTTTMHVAALFAAWGDDPARDFLQRLKANQVRLASSNGEVRRLVAGGEVAFGLTDTDDAHEALRDQAPVAVVYPDQDQLGTLVMPTTVVLIKGSPHPGAGRRLIDFLLSPEVERRMAVSAAHMPLRPGIPLPPGLPSVNELRAMKVDYSLVGEKIETIQPWLREWVGF